MEDPLYFQPPARHMKVKGCSFSNFKPASPSQKGALDFLKSLNAQSSTGVYLFGPTGRGKSHLLVAAARHLKEELKIPVSYCDGQTVWANISQHSISYWPQNPIVSAQVVIIDDIDLRLNDQADSKLFYQFVLQLYDSGKLTLFSSNHSPENLVKKLVVAKDKKAVSTATGGEVLTEFGSDTEMQDRILDRLSEMCLFIDMQDAPEHRRGMQQEYAARFRTQ